MPLIVTNAVAGTGGITVATIIGVLVNSKPAADTRVSATCAVTSALQNKPIESEKEKRDR